MPGVDSGINVTLLCTTDDPADSLKWHKIIWEDSEFTTQVLPAWRPEKAMNIAAPGFKTYMKKLGQAAGIEILDFFRIKARID